MDGLNAWIPYLNNPLVFFSFVLVVLVGVIKVFLSSGKLTRNSSTAIINKILNGVFIIAVLVFIGTMTNIISHPAAQVARIKFDTAGPLIYPGKSQLISVTVFDADGKRMSDKEVSWASMNPEVVGIASAGSFETPTGRVFQAKLSGIARGTALVEAGRDGYNEKILVTVAESSNSGFRLPPLSAPLDGMQPLNGLKSANELKPLNELRQSNDSQLLHGLRPLTGLKPQQ